MHVCSTGERESESIVVDESFTEEIESESVHKSINTNKEKDASDEIDHEKPSVTYNLVINGPSYFKLLGCDKNLLKRIGAMYERAYMASSRDR